MDYQQSGRFSTIPARAFVDRRLDNAALRVLGILGCYSNRFGWCFPSLSELAKETGVSRQAISKQVAVLIELGYLKSRVRFRPNGSQTTNKYQIIFDADTDEDEQIPLPNPTPQLPEVAPQVQLPEVAPRTAQKEQPTSLPPTGGEEASSPAKRKFTKAQRDAVWDAYEQGVGVKAITKRDRGNLGGIVSETLEADITPKQVLAVCAEYERRWPDIDITWRGVYNNLSKLLATLERRSGPPKFVY